MELRDRESGASALAIPGHGNYYTTPLTHCHAIAFTYQLSISRPHDSIDQRHQLMKDGNDNDDNNDNTNHNNVSSPQDFLEASTLSPF